jgi:hypothetical protein
LKTILKIFLYFLIILLIISAIPYILTPVYEFPETKPFSGSFIYNPYKNISPGKWLKANFHAHSNAWLGITNGKNNIPQEMYDRYAKLDYDIISISDYMSINDFMMANKIFIPVYEHGIGFAKSHQLVIGAENVNWTEYLYYQGINQKQYVINQLKKDNNVIAITHPQLRGAYSNEDFKKLCGINFVEVVNQSYGGGESNWDAALSACKVMFALADDDSHNGIDYKDMGRVYTMVNSDEQTPQSVISALKEGRNIAVDIFMNNRQDFNLLKSKSENIPELQKADINDTAISFKFSKRVNRIIFSGQNGRPVNISNETDSAFCSITPNDTYIRTTVICEDSSKLYLNPVFRYDGREFPKYSAAINLTSTVIKKSISLAVLIVIIIIIRNIRKRKLRAAG